jgi:CubicO group peptidase (beta-lactamase class C family)
VRKFPPWPLLMLCWPAAGALAAPGATVPETEERVDRFISAEMRRSRIPGMAVAVLKDSRILVAKGYGLANVEHNVPVTRATLFQSGSMGKQFTATAVMMLAAAGKLSLDDPIDRFFAPAPEHWQRITVRHLLSHTSGLPENLPDLDLRRDYTEDQFLDIAKATPPASAPGERWSYSNLGYVTLGILVRKVSGVFYGDYLADTVFKPLGMRTARVISEADIVPHRAAGYRLSGGELKNQAWVSPSVNTTADGSLYLSLDDMLAWEAALGSGRPLGPQGLEQVWTPARLANGAATPYGFGWFVVDRAGRRILFHGGGWQGFKGFIARFPDDRLTIIFFANQWSANEWRIARGLASLFIPELAFAGPEPVADAEPATTALARKVLRQLASGEPDPELFTPAGRAELTVDRVAAFRKRLEALTLPPALIASIEPVGRQDAAGMRSHLYAITDLAATDIFELRLASDGKIAGIDIRPAR